MVTAEEALPGRDERMVVPDRHEVLGTPLGPPFRTDSSRRSSAWAASGARSGSSGSCRASTRRRSATRAGSRPPGLPGDVQRSHRHTEAVLVVFDPAQLPYEEVLRTFWEGHDPTQGHRRGTTSGTQYRSALYWTTPAQREAAIRSRDAYAARLAEAGTARSRPSSGRRRRSTTPSRTTSSTSRRTRTGTAGSAARRLLPCRRRRLTDRAVGSAHDRRRGRTPRRDLFAARAREDVSPGSSRSSPWRPTRS